MTEDQERLEFVNKFLATVLEKWGSKIFETTRPNLERTAKAIFDVDKFQLAIEEEPASLTSYYYLLNEEDKILEAL
jgi:hypothetical protein